jgi:hypothetical protein
MSISQFEASEKLTKLAIGTTYTNAPFSTLYDHVKDNAIRLGQTECIQQLSSCKDHQTKIHSDYAPAVPPQPPGTPAASDTFIRQDGKKHAYLIPPATFRTMTPTQRTAKLLHLKSDRSRGITPLTATQAVQTPATSGPPVSVAGAPLSIVSYATMMATSSPNVVSALPATSVAPSTTLPALSLPGGSLIHQILSANTTPVTFCTFYPRDACAD